MPEFGPESEKYTPEEARSEASEMREKIDKSNPVKEGVFSDKEYEKAHEDVERQNEMVRSDTKRYFEGICDKYKAIADLGLNFDEFYKTAIEIQQGDDPEIKAALAGYERTSMTSIAPIISLAAYAPTPKHVQYSLHDLEEIKHAAEEARELGFEVDIPDVLRQTKGPIKIEDPSINKVVLNIIQKPEKLKRDRAEKIFSDKFGCPVEKFRDLRNLYRRIINFARISKVIIKVEESEQNNENYSKTTETLNDAEITVQVKRRESIARKVGLEWTESYNPQVLNLEHLVAEKAKGMQIGESSPGHSPSPYDEQEVIYAVGMLGLTKSTKEMVEALKQAMQNAHKSPPKDYRDYMGSYDVREHLFEELWESFFVESLTGKKVFEVGGKKALEGFERMGAVIAGAADAGHSGYVTTFYHTGSREDMIEVANYRKFCDPHSVDLVCSSRLFDMGSGIGEIAEPSRPDQERDRLGEREMMLVLTNILKDGGFMIHFNNPLEESEKGLGVTNLCFVASRAGIYRWHQSDMDTPNDFRIGKKHMVYNSETKIFEKVSLKGKFDFYGNPLD